MKIHYNQRGTDVSEALTEIPQLASLSGIDIRTLDLPTRSGFSFAVFDLRAHWLAPDQSKLGPKLVAGSLEDHQSRGRPKDVLGTAMIFHKPS